MFNFRYSWKSKLQKYSQVEQNEIEGAKEKPNPNQSHVQIRWILVLLLLCSSIVSFTLGRYSRHVFRPRSFLERESCCDYLSENQA